MTDALETQAERDAALRSLVEAAKADPEGVPWQQFWDRLTEDDVLALLDRLEETRAERDAALAAIERVRAVAMQHRSIERHNEMVPITDIVDLIREQSSADYLAALDGAPETEWEWADRLWGKKP